MRDGRYEAGYRISYACTRIWFRDTRALQANTFVTGTNY